MKREKRKEEDKRRGGEKEEIRPERGQYMEGEDRKRKKVRREQDRESRTYIRKQRLISPKTSWL